MLEEIKPVVTEKTDFVYWDEYLLLAIFGFFDLKDFDARVRVFDFPIAHSSTFVLFSMETLIKKQTGSYGETRVRM